MNNEDSIHNLLTTILSSNVDSARRIAIRNANITPEHINIALDDVKYDIRSLAIQNKNVNEDNITKALKDNDPLIRLLAIQQPKVNEGHLGRALYDDNVHVRYEAAISNKLPYFLIHKALTDESIVIKEAAIGNENCDYIGFEYGINEAIENDYTTVIMAALNNKHCPISVLLKLFKHEDEIIRLRAYTHMSVTFKYRLEGLKDKSNLVKIGIAQHLNMPNEEIEKLKTTYDSNFLDWIEGFFKK